MNHIFIFHNYTTEDKIQEENNKLIVKYSSQKNGKMDKYFVNGTTYHVFMRYHISRKCSNFYYIGSTKDVKISYKPNDRKEERIEYIISVQNIYNKIITPVTEPYCYNTTYSAYFQGCFKFLNMKPIAPSSPGQGIQLAEINKESIEIIEEITDEDIPESDEEYYSDDFEEYKDDEDVEEEVKYDNFNDIIDNNSKFICMIKPTQSRKTQVTIQHTIENINNNKKIIQIVDNSLLQNQQFTKRMKNEMNGEMLQELSGRKKKLDLQDFSNIVRNITDGNYLLGNLNTIIACKNYKQLDNIYTIVRLIEYLKKKNQITKDIKFSINIDEIDNTLSLLNRKLEINNEVNQILQIGEKINFWELCESSDLIEEVLCITATPLRLFKYFQENNKKLRIFNLIQTYNQNYYYAFKDCNFTYINQKKSKQLLNYVKYILEHKLKTENSKLFVPAKTFKREHLKLKDLLIKQYNVIIINSSYHKLYKKDGEIIKLKLDKEKELSEELPKIIKDNNLDNIAITGNLSIGRGVTFCSKDFIFTDAIFSDFHLKNNCNAYQIIGRITGNFHYLNKDFDKINVYCSTKFSKTMKTIEKISMEYAIKYSYEEYNHKDIYDDEKQINLLKENRKIHKPLYDGEVKGKNADEIFKKLKEIAKNNNCKINNRRHKKKNGFILQSFENKKAGDEKVYTEKEMMKILKEKGYTSYLSSSDKNGYIKKVFWYYKDINDVNTICAWFKLLKVNKKIEKIDEI